MFSIVVYRFDCTSDVCVSVCAGDDDAEGDGIYVVMAGLVKSSYQTPDGDTQVCCVTPVTPVLQCTQLIPFIMAVS